MKYSLSLITLLAALPALADDSRQLDAHEHGVGTLNIAFDGAMVAMEFHAPGADIVGFEHAAESAEDRAAVDAAIAALSTPLDLFMLPDGAECSVTMASAALNSDEMHDDHDDHKHEDHDDHAEHDDHDHDGAAGHTEFHADYMLTCATPSALTQIDFAYFATFANAREVEVQVITASGAQAFEVEKGAPVLDLRSLF